MAAYADRFGLEGDFFDRFVTLIEAMDETFLQWRDEREGKGT